MKNNPIIPYILIMAFGIGVIFFLSLEGVGNQEEQAAEHAEEGGSAAPADGEAVAKANCIGCHGGDLTGSVGPSLIGVDDEAHIRDVIANGQGTMPGGLVTDAGEVDALVEYILSLQ